MGRWDAIKSYVPGHTIKVLVRHTISVIAALLCFWLTAEVAKIVFPKGGLHEAIGALEGVGFIALLLWFFIQLFIELWKGKDGGTPHAILVA